MLSVLDLLDAGTLDLDLAAFLMARISQGASFLVGARPGGAGKTTVMCALLNLLPPDVPIVAATSQAVRSARPAPEAGRACYVCHEIGAGPYFAYLWGTDLRAYCALSDQGHVLATNLHADNVRQTQDQICAQNQVPERHFLAFRLLIYLGMSGGWRSSQRWVEQVCAGDGFSEHVEVFDTRAGLQRSEIADATDIEWENECRRFLERCKNGPKRTIEEVRPEVVGFLNG